MSFLSAIENRRTHYALANKSPLSNTEIIKLVEHTVKHVPSAFNSQSQRVVVLLGDDHKTLWDLTTKTLKPLVPEVAWKSTQDKMDAFSGAYGTVLFFDETDITEGLMKKFELYKDNFPIWASQSNGMLQFALWTALDEAGLGASLQHYNPLIDEAVLKTWKLPTSWKLMAQMPFGLPLDTPQAKTFEPLESRIRILGQ